MSWARWAGSVEQRGHTEWYFEMLGVGLDFGVVIPIPGAICALLFLSFRLILGTVVLLIGELTLVYIFGVRFIAFLLELLLIFGPYVFFKFLFDTPILEKYERVLVLLREIKLVHLLLRDSHYLLAAFYFIIPVFHQVITCCCDDGGGRRVEIFHPVHHFFGRMYIYILSSF